MNDPALTPGPPSEPPPAVIVARPVQTSGAGRAAPAVNPMELPGVSRRFAALDGLLVLLVAVVAQQMPSLALIFEDLPLEMPQVGPLTVLAKWSELLLVGALAGYFVLRNKLNPRSFGLRSDGIASQLAGGLLALICIYILLAVAIGVVATISYAFGIVPVTEREIEQRSQFIEAMPLDNFGITLVLIFAVAIQEELLFRGLLLPFLRRVTNSWVVAVALTSLVFGLLHYPQGWLAVGIITCIGVALSVSIVISRSLLTVAVAHFLFDLIQLQLMRFWPEISRFIEEAEPV